MSFQQGLSGLNSSSKALDVIGNNIANSSTVGFKSAETHFADVYANSLSGAGASQVGIGSTVSGIQQTFTQGNITATNNPLDISINGDGFFRMSQGGTITYTRNGQFHLDNEGYIINDQNMRLTGYQANAAGVILPSSPVDIKLSASQIAPRATSESLAGQITAGLNLDSRSTVPSAMANATTAASGAAALVAAAAADAAALAGATAASVADAAAAAVSAATTQAGTLAGGSDSAVAAAQSAAEAVAQAAADAAAVAGATVSDVTGAASGAVDVYADAAEAGQQFDYQDPTTYNYSTALSVYDTLGVAHTLTLFFGRTATGDWDVNATLGRADPQSVGTLSFDASGKLTTGMPIDLPEWDLATGADSPWSPSGDNGINFSTTTQYGSDSSVDSLSQGGYAPGSLTGLSVGSDGVVIGRYSNGQARNLGQVVLATFANPNGLQSLGNNQWALTSVSGPELISEPGSGGRGVLQSSAIEESNVDLTAQLVSMITQQRNYQASAQTIKTQDSIMQTLVNLR